MLRLLKTLLILALLIVSALAVLWHWQPGWSWYQQRMQATPVAQAGGLQLRWFGVSALLISDGQHKLFIDPFFSRPAGLSKLLMNREIEPDDRLIRAELEAAGVRHLDAVLVSHSHFDHAMDAGRVAYLSGAHLAGSPSTLNIGRGEGLPAHWLHDASDGQVLTFGPFRVRFIRSLHAGATGGRPTGDIEQELVPPARYTDYRQGGTFSILIEHPLGRILHHGSAGFRAGALDELDADLVVLGVALVDDYAEYFRQVVDAVGAPRIMPVHWDNFTRPLQQPLQPMPVVVRLDKLQQAMAQRPDLKLLAAPLGQPVQAFPAAQP